MRPDIRRAFAWMTAFYAAMAYLESAVVVYLRALYYPEGFDFPLVPMERSLIAVEVWRELATMLMLLAPAALVTRSALERFAWFCFGFGVWDIFYYVWLKVLLGWPAGWATPDLLFLVPVPWVGPVWAPCLISAGLIALALIVLRGRSRSAAYAIDRWSWMLLIGGALVMIVSFMIDPLRHASGMDVVGSVASLGETGASELLHGADYVPGPFPWPCFVFGAALATLGMARASRVS